MDSRALIEDRVRRAVRASDVDPLRDPDAVRALVDAELTQLLTEPSGDSMWARGENAAELARHAFDAVAGFGPLQPLFDDPSIEEVWIND